LNFSLAHVDYAQYNGTRTGLTIDGFKALIQDPSNWVSNNTSGVLVSTDFQIAAVPEASAFVFGGLALCGVGFKMYGRKFWARKSA
ncbi:MAG TPA: hypothetical protein VEQ85_10365, partial [Lacipirellulaceae bacterium]|nr:hypothetical protein [Lacipirellulaceae bacterium]